MKRWFYLVVSLQLLFLFGEVGINSIELARGQTVILKTAPVDPRSLMMGNYMDLSYVISNIDLKKVRSYDNTKPSREIYVGLSHAKPYSTVVAVATIKPSSEGGLVWLRGRVVADYGDTIRIKYGIERYYIPESKSDEANELGRSDTAVEVSVAGDGTGRIRRILAGGKPIGF